MTRSKENQGADIAATRGSRLLTRLPIADEPTLVATGLVPAAEPSLLATLDIATQAIARARAARLSEVQKVEVSPTLTAVDKVGPTTERHRRDSESGDRTGGVRVDMSPSEAATGHTVFIYCAGCTGLRMLALDGADGFSGHRPPIPTSIYKLGTSTGSARTRLLELSATGYAARSDPSGDDENGFDDWTLARIVARPSAVRAILVHGGVIEVRLPATLSPAGFEARLREALEPLLIEHHADGGKRGDQVPRRWDPPSPPRRSLEPGDRALSLPPLRGR